MLCEEPLNGELEHDRDQVFGALREGRCYMAVESLGPPRGFSFSANELPMGAEAAALFRLYVGQGAAQKDFSGIVNFIRGGR